MREKIKSVYKFLSPKFQSVHLEYKVSPKPRWGHGNPAHALLFDSINGNRSLYKSQLESFLKYTDRIHEIKDSATERNENNPAWNNGFLPGLDMVGIYGIIADYKPARYIEIGSGNSIKVARKAIRENNLNTEIISIDPFPRANIDHLADRVIREPFENLSDNKFIVESLNENDILFIDNSHRVFPNSDAMICFLELLPFLEKGVIVQIHDVYLPFDYPQFMCDRFYNEQYMLAAFLLANPQKFQTILPNYFISEDAELAKIISPVWDHPNLREVEKHGGSFWLRIN
ncbi:MAG TPA: class I SAM-dependent methyltransferase [Cryomorphaceae bacterium]|nr:class I SAM-dependent methyltransferase [Cryomorphaceae bacterium]